ncbi:claudin-10 [Engraulis encrasicolus]|uniref:claudin-10 n=1 Tax=Engraulis encrasicolus TaxID=184585 RepID=UPI002FD0A9AD
MKIRVLQIWGFLLSVTGWIFIACSMAMEGWKVTSIGGQGGNSIITVAWYWSSLWRSCFTDSTAVTNCYDFPVLWSVDDHVQIVRALLMGGLSLGMLGFILSLLGMECTYIGGKDKEKNRALFSGGICHVIAGISAAAGYAVYAQFVRAEYLNPNIDGLQFDLGTPLFLGWAGSAFHISGGVFHLVTVCKIWALEYSTTPVLVAPVPIAKDELPVSSKFSTVSEISSASKSSYISKISSRTAFSSVSGITEKTGRSSKTKRSLRSERSARSKTSDRSDERSLGSERSSRSGRSSRSERSSLASRSADLSSRQSQSAYSDATSDQALFIKNSYI